ncbi:MAG: hypothetical protein US40_C0002G0100 [Candidatus Roizmanbacteria bacterium GW2011_GWC2_37_13]|uniref:DUF5666 domain-containing protein n=1 Tax=Candidatus Roizmanbacteria bacterium GW2011_GWC2_37_13 TaxID=1618486 RepID=A0A0G0JEG3_9BACT|nr:MAG: hypothetical protein US38_C0006G0100 [Candidatus Roizmanbacteria bacterium GW2011_GWC1_37_12]KKQ26566.1 MAG: hypothetical protein US40_C0002G0100 [Candidatus Roizmanbacteria bacterium GW2011_GWC2_37_13]
MKIKLLYCYIVILLIGVFANSAFGQTVEENAVQDLKEKVASKVAEIRKKNNKAVSGRVINRSGAAIKIKTSEGDDFDIKLQESGLTKYYQITGAQQKELDVEDIEKDSYILVTGVINDKTITANSVFTDQQFLSGNGKISEVNAEDYIIKVITADKTVYSLSIETYTKQQIVNIKTLEMERIGFSKIKEGDSVHFVFKISGDEKNNEYSADKILVIPQEYFIK